MAFVERDSAQIHYELIGNIKLPVLVLSHSLGVHSSMWDPQGTDFKDRFCLLRYDARGHGQSSVPKGPYTVADLGMDVLAILDDLQLERVMFCGLSMGGVVGQWLGIHASARIERLVLANTAAKIGSFEAWNDRIAAVAEHGIEPIIAGTLQRWFTAGFRASHLDLIDRTSAMLHATSVEGYTGCCAAIRDADFRSSAQAIRIPTLIISGDQDPVTPPSDAYELKSAIPGATLVELEAAHLSNVEAPDSFNKALLKILQD